MTFKERIKHSVAECIHLKKRVTRYALRTLDCFRHCFQDEFRKVRVKVLSVMKHYLNTNNENNLWFSKIVNTKLL